MLKSGSGCDGGSYGSGGGGRWGRGILFYNIYRKLQNVNKLFLDFRLGSTLYPLVAEKCQIRYFSATTTNLNGEVNVKEGEVRRIRKGWEGRCGWK